MGTVKDAGDKNQAGHVAADIMMSGIYGEHEIQERHQKFDEKAEKAMDKPKWDEKLAHYQSEEGKQERIAEILEAKKLSDARKEQFKGGNRGKQHMVPMMVPSNMVP